MSLRGRVMKLERVTHQVERRPGTREDAVLWTRRFRAADSENERVYQEICTYGRTYGTEYVYAERTDEVNAGECFKAIYFPIWQAVNRDSDPRCAKFEQTPNMLRRLVNAAWKYQRQRGDRFPPGYDYLFMVAGPDGTGMRDLWCLYADLVDQWVADRTHPRVLAWRKYREERGIDW